MTYTNWDDPLSPERVREQVLQFLGDVAYNVPAVRAAREHLKHESPNQVNSIYKWVPYNDSQETYLEFSNDMGPHSLKKHLHSGETNFWLKVFPDLVKAFGTMETAGNQSGTSASMHKGKMDIMLLSIVSLFLYITF
ncbi:hypothetical protein MAR_004470 [Mya arenaria]|uniref:Uncharacterized protein n=1 Tax=Mya arenaria TaxID=6604 RepID=A0ABY7EYC9_MYAAR|nr:hypothetical protein MAR_004470 [Mya arenaria]